MCAFRACAALRVLHSCDEPAALSTRYKPIATLVALTYVVGIPRLLLFVLKASPVRAAFRDTCRLCHDALAAKALDGEHLHPVSTRRAVRGAAHVLVGLLFLYTVWCETGRVVIVGLAFIPRVLWACVVERTCTPSVAVAARASMKEWADGIAAGMSSKTAFVDGVRARAAIAVGPYAHDSCVVVDADEGAHALCHCALPDVVRRLKQKHVEWRGNLLLKQLGRDYRRVRACACDSAADRRGRAFARPSAWYWDLVILARKFLILVPQLFSSSCVPPGVVVAELAVMPTYAALVVQVHRVAGHLRLHCDALRAGPAVLEVAVRAGVCAARAAPLSGARRRYKENNMNRLEFMSLACSCLTIQLGLLFRSMQVGVGAAAAVPSSRETVSWRRATRGVPSRASRSRARP